MVKRIFFSSLFLALLILLSGCAAPKLGSADNPVYTDFRRNTAPSNYELYAPIVVTGDGGTLVSIPQVWKSPNDGEDWLGGRYDVCRLERDGLVLLQDHQLMINLAAADSGYYYWNFDGVYRFEPDSNTSDWLFALPEGRDFSRFWGQGGYLYGIQYEQDRPVDDRIYRYDLETGELVSLPWFQDYAEQESIDDRMYEWMGVVGDELLFLSYDQDEELGFKVLWLDLTDGSTRPCGITSKVYGYRDGCLIVYDRFTGSYLFHDVQTGEESPFPIPEEVEAAGEDEFELLGVTEEAAYWRDGMSFYLQRGETFRKVFSFSWERFFYDSTPFYQLNGDTYCFAFFGTPDEGYDLTDLSIHDPALEEGEKMRFAALTPDGKVYILAEEYYNPYWQDF